jgi:hypothetical protein
VTIQIITDSVRESFVVGHRPTGNAQDVDPARPPKSGSALARFKQNQAKTDSSKK